MVAWAGLDQRSFPRVEVKCDIRILGHSGKTIHTKTKNVGGGGVCVLLTQGLERFSSVQIQLILPEGNRVIKSGGRAVWIVKSADPVSHTVAYDTGIEFANLKPEDLEAVLALVEKVS